MSQSIRELSQASIIDLLGLEALPEEQKTKILEQAVDLAQKNITLRLVAGLGDSERTRFYALIDDPAKAEEATIFLQSQCPNMSDIVQEEIAKVKKDLQNVVDKIGS